MHSFVAVTEEVPVVEESAGAGLERYVVGEDERVRATALAARKVDAAL